MNREQALNAPEMNGCREVVMVEPVWQAFVSMIYGRGLTLFQIPMDQAEGAGEDEIPSYAVGFGQ